mmetsp:Transcript_48738/g.150508  ORF Transcript_48738/g.150508 Transcript_48738/m.150508 type:complete len:95 (+) Transcript_48738:244-528(+)
MDDEGGGLPPIATRRGAMDEPALFVAVAATAMPEGDRKSQGSCDGKQRCSGSTGLYFTRHTKPAFFVVSPGRLCMWICQGVVGAAACMSRGEKR